MKIEKKIALSKQHDSFILHREGIFYKCYNEDAIVFVKHIKAYKVLSKFIKIAGEEVLSIGFPVSELEKGNIYTGGRCSHKARITNPRQRGEAS